ncbi:thiosulfate sulfurtransferase YnjE-like [Sycon ciliatum]|uniref:thiosulfate sulfurtransferase YnjE-like n=1 Tax=Sycon ciliatum TaxID=27933 RepID=UPI0031F70D25
MAKEMFERLSVDAGSLESLGLYRLVDVRNSSVFHGWSKDTCSDCVLDNDTGHLPGCMLFSHSWICSTSASDQQHRARQRAELAGLDSSEQPIALIGHGLDCDRCHTDIACSTGKWLVDTFLLPISDIFIAVCPTLATDCRSNHGNECGREESTVRNSRYLPALHRLPESDIFITPEYLATRIGHDGQPVHVVHVGWEDDGVFLAKHIPTAHYVDLGTWEDVVTMNFLSPDCFAVRTNPAVDASRECSGSAFARLLKCPRPKIVLYDDGVGIAASRLGAMLWSLGFTNLSILSGGLRGWCRAGFGTDQLPKGSLVSVPLLEHGTDVDAQLSEHRDNGDVFVDMEFVQQVTLGQHENAVLVSCCSWREYIGCVSGYKYISRKGRIPTARWALSGAGKDDLWHWHDELGVATDWKHLARLWAVAGITHSKHVILYCGTGWRCSAAWFYLRALGYQHVSIYDGGWLEWSSTPSNKVAQDVPVSEWFTALQNVLPSSLFDLECG